jgi:hypothetical protein
MESDYQEALLFSVAEEGYEPERFQTRLLALSPSGNHTIREYPALVVPLDSGFVHVAIERTCGEPDSEDWVDCDESVRVAPVSSPFTFKSGGIQAEYPDHMCGYGNLSVLFVSPRFVATYSRYGATEACNPRGWNWSEAWDVHRIRETGVDPAAVRFAEVFGEQGASAYAAAARAALNHDAAAEAPYPQGEGCFAIPEKDTGWTIRRVRSTWIARLIQQDTPFCQPEADLAVPVDRRVIGCLSSGKR